MHHPLSALIDQIVENAEKRGAFNDLPGAGKPLRHLDDPQNALLNRMIQEADVKSPVAVLHNHIQQTQQQPTHATKAPERKQ